jgi:hypothetical protein
VFTQHIQASRLENTLAVSVKPSSLLRPARTSESYSSLVDEIRVQSQKKRLKLLEGCGGNKWLAGIISVFIVIVDSISVLKRQLWLHWAFCKTIRKLRQKEQ